MFSFYFTFFLCVFGNCLFTNALQCRNEANEPVDWFTVYKIPKIKHNSALIQKGVGYVYVTSANCSEWTLSKFGIDDNRSMIAKTVETFYSKSNISYLLYNDQPPDEPSKPGKGHTKGVILADLEGGLWLIHSVPHFLQLTSQYQYPETGLREGQSFLCISLDLKNLNKVGTQLQYNEPQIYATYVQQILETKLSQIVEAASGSVIKTAPWYNEVSITSRNGVKFQSFAKSKKFGKDLYHDYVAPALQSDLFTETWLNGPGKLSSNCTNRINVYNVQMVSLMDRDISFSSSEDHSKWAVGVHTPWTCIGDINRMEHQKFRGGGTVCLNNFNLTERYRTSIDSIQKCLSNIF